MEKLSDRWMFYCGLLAGMGVGVDDLKHIQDLIDVEEQGLLLRASEEIPIIHGKAELEEHEKEIRNKAIDEFVEKLATNVESFQAEVNGIRADLMTEDYFHEYIWNIAEQMKGV